MRYDLGLDDEVGAIRTGRPVFIAPGFCQFNVSYYIGICFFEYIADKRKIIFRKGIKITAVDCVYGFFG